MHPTVEIILSISSAKRYLIIWYLHAGAPLAVTVHTCQRMPGDIAPTAGRSYESECVRYQKVGWFC